MAEGTLAEQVEALEAERVRLVGALVTADSELAKQDVEIAALKARIAELEGVPVPVPVGKRDALGALWTIDAQGRAVRDGVVTPSAEVVTIEIVAGLARQTNKQKSSWDWEGAANGRWIRWVDVAPPPDPVPVPVPGLRHLVGSHTMAALSCSLDGNESAAECVKRHAELGMSWIWLHFDNPPWNSGNYATALDQFLNAAQAWNAANAFKVYIVPGMHGNGSFSQADFAKMFADYATHPAVMRRADRRPMFAVYDYQNGTTGPLSAAVAAFGSAIDIWAYPEAVVVPELTDKTYTGLEGWLSKLPPYISVISFAVNWATADGKYISMSDPVAASLMVKRNDNIANVCRKLGRTSVGGYAMRNNGRTMADADILTVQDANLANPCDFWCVTTWNDSNKNPGDESAVGNWGTDFDAGDIVWRPQRNAGYGTPQQYPRNTRLRALVAPKLSAYMKLP